MASRNLKRGRPSDDGDKDSSSGEGPPSAKRQLVDGDEDSGSSGDDDTKYSEPERAESEKAKRYREQPAQRSFGEALLREMPPYETSEDDDEDDVGLDPVTGEDDDESDEDDGSDEEDTDDEEDIDSEEDSDEDSDEEDEESEDDVEEPWDPDTTVYSVLRSLNQSDSSAASLSDEDSEFEVDLQSQVEFTAHIINFLTHLERVGVDVSLVYTPDELIEAVRRNTVISTTDTEKGVTVDWKTSEEDARTNALMMVNSLIHLPMHVFVDTARMAEDFWSELEACGIKIF
ncbi:hypothetical protein AAE478_002076 [Parahypoxylon ruwenzoriense]